MTNEQSAMAAGNIQAQTPFSTTPASVPVKVGTHFVRQEYLFAFATQAEVLHYLRTQTVNDDLMRLQEIMQSWLEMQPRVADLVRLEAGIADTMRVSEIPEEHRSKIERFAADNLFRKSFSQYPVRFAMVEIDKLVAPQRTVNLDYVAKLAAKFAGRPSLEELLDVCVSPKREMEAIQHLEVGPNAHVFSSPNSDIRFLGAFLKQLTNEDLEHAMAGGLPAAAVISFVGYGAAPVNVFRCQNRVVLNNGFHRVYALRSLGVSEIPVVVQCVNNPQLEFPPQVVGLPKEYLLGTVRPVIMKDFFEPGFTTTVKVRDRLKMVSIQIGGNQHDIPA